MTWDDTGSVLQLTALGAAATPDLSVGFGCATSTCLEPQPPRTSATQARALGPRHGRTCLVVPLSAIMNRTKGVPRCLVRLFASIACSVRIKCPRVRETRFMHQRQAVFWQRRLKRIRRAGDANSALRARFAPRLLRSDNELQRSSQPKSRVSRGGRSRVRTRGCRGVVCDSENSIRSATCKRSA